MTQNLEFWEAVDLLCEFERLPTRTNTKTVKRPKYEITYGGKSAVKHSWNSALRAARELVRDSLPPGKSAMLLNVEREELNRWTTLRGTMEFTTGTASIELANREEMEA